jgi:hypothetical protein
MAKKIVRITESEINNIVKKVLKEEDFITRVGSPLDSIENYVKEKYGIKEHQYIKNNKKFVVEPGNGWGMDIRLQDDYGMFKNHVGGEMFIATYELDYTLQGMEHKYHHGIKKKVKTIEELKRAVDEFFNGGLRREDNR